MARFHVSDVKRAAEVINPVFLRSPQYEYGPLSNQLGTNVVLKVETLNPIRSFKGRGADLLMQTTSSPIICASAGNFGQAMAYAARTYGVTITVVAALNANLFKIERMKALGAEVILHGSDFDSAKEYARQLAVRNNQRFVEDSADVETAIGAGTIALELMNYPEQLDVLLVPVGNGALINGIGRVYKDRNSPTEIIGVQAEGAPAMTESWKHKTKMVHESINTIADGIGVRIPVNEALEDMYPVVDDMLLVSDNTILKAMKLLQHTGGLITEPAGAAGIAALLDHSRFKSMKVGVILCGSNLTTEQMKLWLN